MIFMECILDDLLAGVIDYRGKTPTKTDSGVRLVTAKVIKQGRVMSEGPQEYIAAKDYDEVMRRGTPQCHDILITTEAPLGELALWDSDEQIALAQRVILLRPDSEKIDPHYLFYHLRSSYFQDQLHANSTGTTVPGIKNPVLRSLLIRYPVKEQQQIIGKILAHYDDLIETNRCRIDLLEESVRLLYREWFVCLRYPGHEHEKIVDGLPLGWSRKTVEDMSLLLSRGIAPKYDDAAPGLVINQKCIRDGRLNLKLARSQSKEVKEDRLVQLGDVLINSTGAGTLGRVAQVRVAIPDCTVDTHVTIVRPSVADCAGFLGVALLEMEQVLSTMGVGSTNQLELGRASIGAMRLLVPTRGLIREFHDFVWPIFDQVEILSQANLRLAQVRDELLPKFMAGEIRL